eukprot:4306403-Prymnesium_polylepis.1
MDSYSLNFDPVATRAGLCVARIFGCTDSAAINYASVATGQSYRDPLDGSTSRDEVVVQTVVVNGVQTTTTTTYENSCNFAGCTNSIAPNYNPSASQDDGLCTPILAGCLDSRYYSYSAAYNVHDASFCTTGGCTTASASNFDPLA